jgi:shikimate kinase
MEALRLRGFLAIDTDYHDWCELSTEDGEPEWIWREDRMRRLLLNPETLPLFVSGCCSNQRKFYELFDLTVLFSAPLEVMLQRVTSRTSNPYGKTEQDRANIISNFEQIQPLLQKSADIEIDTTTMSVNQIADFLSELALLRE